MTREDLKDYKYNQEWINLIDLLTLHSTLKKPLLSKGEPWFEESTGPSENERPDCLEWEGFNTIFSIVHITPFWW